MVISNTYTFEYPNKEIQRVQKADLTDWNGIDFYKPIPSEGSFSKICDLYENYIIPKAPYIFGTLVFFALPEDIDLSFTSQSSDPKQKLIAAAALFDRSSHFGSFSPTDPKITALIDELRSRGLFRVIKGKRPLSTKIMPVSSELGFLSSEQRGELKVNSNFFIMDMFDVGSLYDSIGTPIGMRIKDGHVFSPPLYNREALMVYKDGSVKIEIPKLKDFTIRIRNILFEPYKNCRIYERSEKKRAGGQGITSIVISGNTVIDIKQNSICSVPSCGFVLCAENKLCQGINIGDCTAYSGAENVIFGIQAGNSAIKDGVKTESFVSMFSNVKNIFTHNVPPSLYPLDYNKDRAPRIVLGADTANKPVILWIEGPGKNGYIKGKDSCGASLSEAAEICEKLKIRSAINLDGGGSAQILINGKRSLMISDRKPDGTEAERPVPIGLIIN